MNQEEIERRMREGRNSLKPLIEEETDYQSDQDLKKTTATFSQGSNDI